MTAQIDKATKLPKSIKVIWRIKELIGLGITLIIAGVLEFIHFMTSGTASLWWQRSALILALLGVVVTIFTLILIEYRWNFWTYYIDDRQVELHNGYFFRKQIVIPIARVQNVTLKQGPILRWKALQKVIIVTAAGSDVIDGLQTAQADNLKVLIMTLAREAKNDI
ncbi:PH domain-containing protein [Agrilactobacillus yilanensis]|uniref:PH domain-containing protein n=1 Tax=Agrilactobacillus yilanensis TaxID=2485997 RepID=A0ABW4J7L1_9LACO|nr:PH domain-containing protein [Agrilactobacillus yilanensis]